jgi:hypothetical protein
MTRGAGDEWDEWGGWDEWKAIRRAAPIFGAPEVVIEQA